MTIGRPHAKAIGSGSTVAEFLQKWFDEYGLDGFNTSCAIKPSDFEDIIKHLLLELRTRDLFWDDYEAVTTRENYYGDGKGRRLRDEHPGFQYQWAGERGS